jgi:DNA-binding response OmpR family regulator
MTGNAPTPPVSVLVVEDEPDIRELIAMNLRREGYKVFETTTEPPVSPSRAGNILRWCCST